MDWRLMIESLFDADRATARDQKRSFINWQCINPSIHHQ